MVFDAPLVRLLRNVTVLSALSPDELRQLAADGEEVACAPGHVVQHAGNKNPRVAVVVEGAAGLWEGNQRVGELATGDVIANQPPLDLLTGRGRVIADTPLRLLELPPKRVAELLNDTSVTAALLQRSLARLRGPAVRRSDESGSSSS
jgi:CRP-like cAMP-binding protein